MSVGSGLARQTSTPQDGDCQASRYLDASGLYTSTLAEWPFLFHLTCNSGCPAALGAPRCRDSGAGWTYYRPYPRYPPSLVRGRRCIALSSLARYWRVFLSSRGLPIILIIPAYTLVKSLFWSTSWLSWVLNVEVSNKSSVPLFIGFALQPIQSTKTINLSVKSGPSEEVSTRPDCNPSV